jgi:hypothetical protein
MHRNESHTLRALGGTVVSEWHGRGAVHGRSGAGAARGIGRGCAGEIDGEVTGRGVVGAGPAHVSVHCKHGVDPG